MISRLRELQPYRLKEESTYSTRIDAIFFLKRLPRYYGLMAGRSSGSRSRYFMEKAIRMVVGDYSLITKEDLNAV